jgi:Na+/H+ antiporter NhaD/arsenite permease-like protein
MFLSTLLTTATQPLEPGSHTLASYVLQSSEIELLPALISAVVFLLVFIAISFQLLHETAAALLGAVTIFLITYIVGSSIPSLHILTFDDAMAFVDWNVIILILGMMIFMAILAETNVFRWLAYRLFSISRGRTWLLVVGLVTLTGLTSAFLNDVTAILLIVPLSIQIALAIDLHPFAIVIPEVMASNIGGAATLIGDPPSTIVGSHIGLGFAEYFVNMAPVALICMIALIVIMRLQYRQEFSQEHHEISNSLLERLALESVITNRRTLGKALIIGLLTFVLFFLGDRFGQMPPSVPALAGAALLIAWVRPQMHHMLREVDWTTLLFFIALFIVVGAMDATGAIGWAASRIAVLAGQSADLAAMLTIWISGFASAVVANIPFTVAALPVADLLTQTIPAAADSGIVYWALILGADLGGNATYLGSAPNIVAVGLLAQAGYRLSFGRFLRDGLPVTLVTLLLSSIYLILRY